MKRPDPAALSGRCKTHHGSYVVTVMTRILIALLAASPVMAIEAVTMEALTGGRPWKLAWLAGNGDQLMALDPAGEPRELLSGRGRLAKPLIAADGSSVIVTRLAVTEQTDGNSHDPEILSIPWTGGTARSLGSGMAIAIWPGTTPDSPFVYAFAALSSTKRGTLTGETIVRFHPAKPEEREIVWSERSASPDNFQLSRDGRRACGLFPWPQAGLADLNSQTWTGVGHGAWPTLAPDNSYALLLLDGSRKQLRCYVPLVDPGWKLNLAEVPTLSGGGINHLRWSNDATIITFTGPWDDEGKGDARIQAVRLRPDLKSLEAVHVAAVTAGNPDSPDLWISGTATSLTSLPQTPQPEEKPASAAAAWPTPRDGLTFAWDRRGSPHDPALKGMAFYGPGGAVNVSAGLAEFPAAATAPLFDAVRKSGSWSLECLVTERRSIPPLSVRLLSLRNEDGSDAAALYRVDGKLVLRTLTGGRNGSPATQERFILTSMFIEDDRPFSLVITSRNKRIACYVDGQLMREFTTDAAGCDAWKAGRFHLGDNQPYGSPWSGSMERVAFYSRELGKEEVEEAWQQTSAQLASRTRPTRNLVKAKLLEWPDLPDAAQLAAAPAWLQATVWEVEQVYTGAMTDKRITRLHWAVLDGKPVPRPDIKVGQSMEFSLEPASDHPETGEARLHNAVSPGDLPVWIDATVPGRHKPPFPAP